MGTNVKVNIDVERVKALVFGVTHNKLEEGLQILEAEAKRRSPYETGTNRRSIEHEISDRSGEVVGSVYTTSGYGGWLEILPGLQRRSRAEQRANLKGTGGSTKYMMPAFEAVKDKILQLFQGAI